MKKAYPIYTTVEREPKTICKKIDETVFDFPFFNVGVLSSREKAGEAHELTSVKVDQEGEMLEIKGFIFNASHCGSTLVCRMLNQIEDVRVVSESEAINGLLLSKVLYSLPDDEVMDRLIEIIRLYRQKYGTKRFLIIKFTSWNVYFIDLITQAFSGIKWIFLDRDTEDLTKSLMKSDGGFIDWWYHPVDVVRRHFLDQGTATESKETYVRAMISGHRKHANRSKSNDGLFLTYPNFIKEYEEIIHHFQLDVTAEEIDGFEKMLTYDSKSMINRLWKKN